MARLWINQMVVLTTMIVLIHTLFLPISMGYAGTVEEQLEDQRGRELPATKNKLEEDLTDDPLFFFDQPQLQGTVNKPIKVNISSNQEVSKMRVILPEEALIVDERFPTWSSIEQGEQPQEWIIQLKQAQTTFVLPLVFDTIGNYELSVEGTTINFVINECEESDADNSSSVNINQALNTEIETVRNGTNHLINPNFTFNRGVDTTIPHWELASSTTPVNFLSRNLTISQAATPAGWHRLSDSDFQIGGIGLLGVNRTSGTRTLMVSQTIQTVQGHTYDVQVNARSVSPTENLTITAYNGNGVIAGPNALNSATYALDSNTQTYSIRFTATSGQTTIGFRLDGVYTSISNTSVTPVQYSLKLESLPSVGGNAQADVDLLIQGQTTTIVAIPNPGYRFVGWQSNTGTNAVIGDTSATSTTITMGNSDVTLKAVFEKEGLVFVNHIDSAGNKLADSKELRGAIGESYETSALEIENYKLIEKPKNAQGTFTEENINVTYIYDISQVRPVDPLEPEVEVDPESKPKLPENQGFLSVDFVSKFNFGVQKIAVSDQTYYAKPQRLLNEDGTVNDTEERPNYVQVSDRRSDNDRNGWNLAVTQNTQFATDTEHSLLGAQLQLMNQQVVTAQEGQEPTLQATNPLALVPGNKRTLLRAEGTEGTGTWIYRFGDGETAQESIALHVPKGTNPHAEMYQTTLTWELSAVPGN